MDQELHLSILAHYFPVFIVFRDHKGRAVVLGLSIAQNLAEKIQATISITEGLHNKGIGFIITLPLKIKPLDNE
ncbi:swarming motility regulation two-component system, sensor kinase [Proteus mirabilis]|uniref:Swarming motility regulation two-component system, sensor kinase n=1 Tax=Proteus mirabilis TaxID=584 RepID=A0A379GHG8_PROMI|nr:swarming motility regulation two-component system, sensor kinase [Proteus mirabilis]